MDAEKYFQDITDKLEALTDDEFHELLIKSGLERCELEVEEC